jgi:hypothetical protein
MFHTKRGAAHFPAILTSPFICFVLCGSYSNILLSNMVHAVVEALRYKSEGNGFSSRLCHWNISLTYSLRQHYDSGVDAASDRNEYHEYLMGVKTADA